MSTGASPSHNVDDDETSMDVDTASRSSLFDADQLLTMVVPRYNDRLVCQCRGVVSCTCTSMSVLEIPHSVYLLYIILFKASVESYVTDVIREQVTRRQAMDSGSRNLLRLMTATAGYADVRAMAMQRLEMWLANPKVSEN